ncbi:MAG: DUF2207 domain-containing protein [Wenzhouxiangellaceae bacterium]
MSNRIVKFAVGLLALLAASASAHEGDSEFIESFATELRLDRQGSLAVTHRVEVHPHGDEIRRGVYFEPPDAIGPRSGYAATVDGRTVEPEFDDGAVILAAADHLAVHETHRLELSYRAEVPFRQLSDGQVVLEWTPVIGQFELPWRTSTVTLSWPEGAMPVGLPSAGERTDGAWRIRFDGPLAGAAESTDIGALNFEWNAGTWPDQVVRRKGVHWVWRAAPVLAVLALFGFLHSAWRAVGRDPEIGQVRAVSEPPQGISPAAARYIEKMSFDMTAFVAALISMKVKGRLSMEVDSAGKKLSLKRAAHGRNDAERLSPGERALERTLFADSSKAELQPGGSLGAKAAGALKKALGREHRGRHFTTNNRQRVMGLVLGGLVVALGIGVLVAELGNVLERDNIAIALGFAAIAFGILMPIVYFELFKAPTRAGLKVKREIAGLKKYLEDTGPCNRSADHFVELLPYAVALEAEGAWMKRFGDRLDDSDGSRTAEIVAWYRRLSDEADSAAAIVPIIAASAGATAATSAGASGASAGGV